MENKKYIKKMQKQIVKLKKYIVFLENRCTENDRILNELRNEIEHLSLEKRVLICFLGESIHGK